jgi:hypothetical protein
MILSTPLFTIISMPHHALAILKPQISPCPIDTSKKEGANFLKWDNVDNFSQDEVSGVKKCATRG